MNKYINLNLDSISKELRLLLEILKLNSNTSIRNELIIDIEWDHFLELAIYHRVYPLIYSKLVKQEEKIIPSSVMNVLKQEYKKNTFQMLYLSGEMEQVSKLFTESNIRLLYLKGPVIAAELYGDISLRTSKDLDILISITDLAKAEELLINEGYEREGDPTVLNDWKWREHHISYFHSKKQIQLEIHWRLHPRPSKEPNFDELWERKRKRKSELTTYPVYYLGKEDLFLYLITHGARHGWFRLRWLMDIDKVIRKGIGSSKINLFLKKYKSSNIGGQALILASQLLNTPINEISKRLTERNHSVKLAQQAIYFINETEPLDVIMSTKYYKRYLFSLKSVTQKLVSLLISFYPSSVDAKTLSLPKSLHFLYYPLHPVLWVWRKTRKSA